MSLFATHVTLIHRPIKFFFPEEYYCWIIKRFRQSQVNRCITTALQLRNTNSNGYCNLNNICKVA